MPRPRPIVAALLFLSLVVAGTARAQGPPPPAAPVRAVPADTLQSHWPAWLRPWGELGGGWMAGPKWLKRSYESGQGLALGLEARSKRGFAVRTALDYQTLQATANIPLYFVTGTDVGGSPVLDTLSTQYQASAWTIGSRTELGVRLPWNFWATGGGGIAWESSGLEDVLRLQTEDGRLDGYPAALRNGWSPYWTASVRWEFEPAPEAPLGLETRYESLRRGSDDVALWKIRLSYRFPIDAKKPNAPRR